MEHVDIITKEAITRGLAWPPLIFAAIGIGFALSVFAVLFVKPRKYLDKCYNLMLCAAACIPVMLVTMLICTIFFPVETGHYTYTATLDREMTITEFEEFQQSYDNITYEDGVWYFEDKRD